MKQFIFSLATIALLAACNQKATDKTTTTGTKETVDKKLEEVTPDYKTLPLYLTCKIDGQPFLAANEHGSITNINAGGQVMFSASAPQVTINGETKISEFEIRFFSLNTKGAATITSGKDFHAFGHTDFPENGKLKYVSFTVQKDQQLTINSYKDGLIEADFAFDMVDENDPTHILKITDGHLKLQQTGKPKAMQADANGDVDINKVLNEAMGK